MSRLEVGQAANPEQRPTEPGLQRVIGYTAGWMGSGFVLGANVANWKFAPETEIGPGLVVRASLTGQKGLYSDWGPLAKAALPNFPVHAGPIDGIRIDPVSIGGQPPEEALNNVAGHTSSALDSTYALFTHFDSTVTAPIQEALVHRFLIGGGLGAVGIGAVAGTIAYLKRRGDINIARGDRLKAKLEEAMETTTADSVSDTAQPSISTEKRRLSKLKKVVPLLGVAAMIGFGAGPTYLTMTSNPLPGYEPQALPASLTSQAPELADGTFSGPVDPQMIMDGYHAFKGNTDKRLAITARNVVTSNRSFALSNERYQELIAGGKKYVKVGLIADEHCNFANMEQVLPLVIKETNPDIVVDLGDIENFAGTFPYEKNCHRTEVSKLGGRKFIWINGNHDKKKGGLNGYKKIGGLYFVGADDPEDTTFSSDKSADLPELDRGLVLQGEYIARTACDIYKKTGQRVVALAHRWQALSAAMRDGECISVGDSAHTHQDGGLRRILAADGESAALQHTAPSFSGAELNLPYYHYAIDGGYVMQIFDAETSTLVAEVDETFRTNGDVSIKLIEPPSIAETTHMFKDYLVQHGHYKDLLADIFGPLPTDPMGRLQSLNPSGRIPYVQQSNAGNLATLVPHRP